MKLDVGFLWRVSIKMVKVSVDVDGNSLPCELYLDGFEKENLDHLNKAVHQNWDLFSIIVGREGSGKTTWALQRALYMDAGFNINKVVFNEQQFIEATETLPHGSSIVWDESDAASDHWASNIVRSVIKRLKRCRKNNYKIFLVTPTFFDFGKYFALHRASFLVDVYADGLQRGNFRFMGVDKMRVLYILGKKMWNMRAVKPDFKGRFTNYPSGFPIDMSDGGEYDVKKDQAMKVNEEESLTNRELSQKIRLECIPRLYAELDKKKVKFSDMAVGRIFGVEYHTVQRSKKEAGLK